MLNKKNINACLKVAKKHLNDPPEFWNNVFGQMNLKWSFVASMGPVMSSENLRVVFKARTSYQL